MQLEEKKVYQLDEFLFMLGFIPFFIIEFLGTSTFHEVINLNLYKDGLWNLTLGIFLIKVLIDKFKLSEIFIYLIAVASVYVSYKLSGSTVLYVMIMMVLMSRYVRSDLIAKVYFSISVILFVLVIGSALAGVIPNLTYMRNGFARHAFGIIYTTDFASHVFYLICGYVFLRAKSYKIYDSIGLMAIAVVLYMFTQARMNVLCIVLLIVGRHLINFDHKNILQKVAWVVPSISMFVIAILSIVYQATNPLLHILDKLFSGRLRIVHSIINNNGFSLFGQYIKQNGWGGSQGLIRMKVSGFEYQFIDSAYMRLLLLFGLATTIILTILLTYLLYKNKNKYLLLVLVVILISGTVEQHMLEIAYNPFFIILFAEFFRNQLAKNNKGITL